MRNALARAAANSRPAVAALLKTVFVETDKVTAIEQWNAVADRLRDKHAKISELMDASRDDVLAYMDFPREHLAQIHSTNPLERSDREIKRRADVVGVRLALGPVAGGPHFRTTAPLSDWSARSPRRSNRWRAGGSLLEQNDEGTVARRSMSLEHLARFGDTDRVRRSAVAT